MRAGTINKPYLLIILFVCIILSVNTDINGSQILVNDESYSNSGDLFNYNDHVLVSTEKTHNNNYLVADSEPSSDDKERSSSKPLASKDYMLEEKVKPESSLRREILNTLENLFPPYLTTFVISMLPIFELRGSIPIGINYFRLDPVVVYLMSIVGNMIPIFFILLFFDGVVRLLSRNAYLKKLLDLLFERTRKKTKLVEKYEELALIFFVAIPLPITGAWTGSLAAYLVGLKFWKSILCIFMGVLISSIIVTTLSLMGSTGAIIALTVLTLFFLYKIIMIKNKRKYEIN